jgi:hypothetical protein
VIETDTEIHLFDSAGRSLATIEVLERLGVYYAHGPRTAERRCVSVGSGLFLDTETGATFEPVHDPEESSADGCVFATRSPRTPAFYLGGERFELKSGTDIVGISPDGSVGIAYRDGWYWTFDLRSPNTSFQQLVESSEPNRTFAFVTT